RLPVSLYLDATGGVVSKIADQPKRILYYSLTLPGKGRDTPPLPICEMLSNEHSVPPITYWLMQFILHLSKYTQIHIHQVETDYSWALMQSVLLGFNREDITAYLERAFDISTGKKTQDDMKPYTVLHLCSAHILKAVRQAISKQTDDQGLRDFVTFAFARLQNACSLAETRHIFSALCSVLTTPKSSENVKASLQILESVIAKPQEGKLDETMETGDMEKWDCEDINNAATTIVGSSPFIPYFRQIFEEAKEHST
ncbi:hypothetical protein M9458_055652, partial [Cirrhinus mrigala]